MPAALIRRVPPGGVPGQQLTLTRRANGPDVYIGQTDITTAGSDWATVQAWTASAQAQGLVPVRFPTGLLAGQLATRLPTPDPVTGWDYQLAPFLVRVADNLRAANDTLTMTDGAIAAELESASKAVLAAPTNLASWALGIPKWAVVGGGVVLLYLLASQVLPRMTGWRSVE